MKKCEYCGSENKDNAKSCKRCGGLFVSEQTSNQVIGERKSWYDEFQARFGTIRKKSVVIFVIVVIVLVTIITSIAKNSKNNTPATDQYTEEETGQVGDEQDTQVVSEYILPDSNSRYLTNADLEGLTAEQLRIARNEIYARHGRRFNDAGLQAHFDSCSWYSGTITPEAFTESMLNEYEVANRDLIVSYEASKGYR